MSASPIPTEPNVSVRAKLDTAARNPRLMFLVSTILLVLACGYFAVTSRVSDPLHLYIGLTIFCLATLPALLWAKGGGRQLPLFEVLMLTTANSYAMPILSGHEQMAIFPDDLVSHAGLGVILYQAVAILTYGFVGGHPGRSRFFTDEVLSRDIHRFIGYGLTITTVYTYITTFHDLIPNDLVGVLRAVFYGIGLVSAFVQAQRWGTGELSSQERILFSINLAIQVTIQFSTLFLVGGMSIVILALVGYVSGSRRLPFILTIVALLLTSLLHSGKSAMRAKYWDSTGGHRQATITELPAFYGEWIEAAMQPVEGPADKKMAGKLLERSSLVHILCLVMSITPERLPYLDGLTYSHIPGQFIPRFFWPEKPVGHISTYTLSIYYGLQREEDVSKTTIGFGTLAEAYANFGFFGMGMVACFYGVLYKKLQMSSINSPILSYAGLLQIVLMAWSFQTEYPMSMWLSSMFQACVAVIGLPFIIRNLFG
jgi:hypothetical protein